MDPVVHRPNLVKRLQDIEKKLKIPLEDRSRCSGELREAPFVIIKAARVQPLSFDAQGRPINDTPELHKFLLVTKKVDDTAEVHLLLIVMLLSDESIGKAHETDWEIKLAWERRPSRKCGDPSFGTLPRTGI